jgi:transcriptional regulator with XRE-family HTH domain
MNARHYDHDKLKKLRESRNLTQKQVAVAVNVDRQTVYRAEAGDQAGYDLLCDLCELYGVSILAVIRPQRVTVCCA